MRLSPLFLVGLGLALDAQAGPLSARSTRTFRELTPGGVVVADIAVAYEDPDLAPSGYNVLNPTKTVNPKTDLPALLKLASEELSNATNHVVQLGAVTVIPTTPKSDPDILIVNSCPTGVVRLTDQAAGLGPVCADANTGGYVGMAWWEQTSLLGTDATQEIFPKTSNGVSVLNGGARITITWQTLKEYGASALVHEFGHYLFAMRDEYEASLFTPGVSPNFSKTYLDAASQNPTSTATGVIQGVALAGGTSPQDIVSFTDFFKGFPMGYVADFMNPTFKKAFSPALVPVVTTGDVATEGQATVGGKKMYWVPEQFATVVTRGNGDVNPVNGRRGSMWSLATAIRTAFNRPYSIPTATLAYQVAETKVDAYNLGQSNIFVFDRSGSMSDIIYDGMFAGRQKSEIAMDFFGRMTHANVAGSNVTYANSAKFGVVAFDDTRIQPQGMEYKRPLSDLTRATIQAPAASLPLVWMQAPPGSVTDPALPGYIPQMPLPGNTTDIVSALNLARDLMDKDLDRPFMRNVILTSDGLHNTGPADFQGNEATTGKYRLFSVTIGTLPSETYGKIMQELANNSEGPDNVHGQAFFTSEIAGTSPTDGNLELISIANRISAAINNAETIDYGVTNLFRDAAQEFPLNADATQTSATMSLAYSGTVAPTLYLIGSNGQTITEAGIPGVVFSQQSNFKTFNIDLTKFSAGTWKLRATTQSGNPLTIYPSSSVKSSKLQINPVLETKFASATGRFPVTVVIQDGRPVKGLSVVANLRNVGSGVVRSLPLTWNGSAYTGTFTGTLQPGVSKLDFVATHPNNASVTLVQGENTQATAPPMYPYFKPHTVSRDVFIDGKANTKTDVALEAWTIQDQPAFAQGTAMKLFLKNNTTVPWTGLKARYFFSVSEIPNGVPGFSPINLVGGSKVKVGTVLNRPGLAYVEFDFAGKTLQPNAVSGSGQNGGEGLYVIDASWRTPWNPLNDYSFQGLKTTWSVNSFVNIYDANGKLLVGNPDLDQATSGTNSTPIVVLNVPNLLVAGATATYSTESVDPDGDALRYTWIVDGVTRVLDGSSSTFDASLAAGAHTLSVVVDDKKSSKVTVTRTINVQVASTACTEASSIDLGKVSTPKALTLVKGVNCFKVDEQNVNREWKWKNIVFQANSSGVSLSGASVQALPVGAPTSLAGYTQTVNFADPGVSKNLYLKVVSNASKAVTLNWWLQ
ncbi:MAG: VWA domain-containing protein [Fibrobacterota bacterium]|nr:VWA domain-containing protein [Fibrobacterota bacterium]QQS06137.1 MAG: VWA domain-containing protein [Fibrobacterota bacterium]